MLYHACSAKADGVRCPMLYACSAKADGVCGDAQYCMHVRVSMCVCVCVCVCMCVQCM